MAGRPPKPAALRIVDSGGKVRARDRDRVAREPRPTRSIGPAPKYLTSQQRSAWHQIVRAAPVGLITALDAHLVEAVAVLGMARQSLLEQFIAGRCEPLATSADGRPVLAATLREYRRLTDSLVALSRELGFSPTARARVSMLPREAPVDPLAEFLALPR
jgi:phage terminase small subunit